MQLTYFLVVFEVTSVEVVRLVVSRSPCTGSKVVTVGACAQSVGTCVQSVGVCAPFVRFV